MLYSSCLGSTTYCINCCCGLLLFNNPPTIHSCYPHYSHPSTHTYIYPLPLLIHSG
ncbi:hypothetical protein K492DRAFT_72994 [Lichtheimia hyalospora FSU 10163]|nr:hypothetical protein K492DRAFT_72994 [Lichtheimia hyalospora FSU 10163]